MQDIHPTQDTAKSEVEEVSKKRRHLADAVKEPSNTSEATDPAIEDAVEELATKKRKTRSNGLVLSELIALGADDDEEDNVVIPQRERKPASEERGSETVVADSLPLGKSLDPEVRRMIAAEEKRNAAAASGSVFSRNAKLRRSFNDAKAAAIMNRPNRNHLTKVEVVPAPKNGHQFAPVRKMADSSSATVRPGAVTHEGDMTIVDLRTIKCLNPTANIRMVHIDRIMELPFLYPNVRIETDERNRPVMAYVTKMKDDEYKLAVEASTGRHKEQVKLDRKLARQNKGSVVTQKKSTLHNTVGRKVASSRSMRGSTESEASEESAKRKGTKGNMTKNTPRSEAAAAEVSTATSNTKKGTATKVAPRQGLEKSSLKKVASGRVTRQTPKSGPRSP